MQGRERYDPQLRYAIQVLPGLQELLILPLGRDRLGLQDSLIRSFPLQKIPSLLGEKSQGGSDLILIINFIIRC